VQRVAESTPAAPAPASTASGEATAPAAGAAPTAEAAEQSVERLAEQVWQLLRHRLRIERERQRGLP
jgi:hypothetical protein